MSERDAAGLLFIGDPHLSTRAPGFRKDEYADTVLEKLRWCMDYARQEKLLPILLGDLFHHPRDISNRLLVELLLLFRDGVWAIAGNHDVSENSLCDHDTLAVLTAARCVRLLDKDGPLVCDINGATVVVGGSAWGQPLPCGFDSSPHRIGGRKTVVFWTVHHDIRFPGHDDTGRLDCREIPGIDVMINGHIHRTLADRAVGATTWMNPGNISRVSRSDATLRHAPGVLRFEIQPDAPVTWRAQRIELPHRPFDEVFHPQVAAERVEVGESVFISELAALESARTSGGAGLQAFLDANLGQFSEPVACEIRELATEVLHHAR